MGTKAVLIVIYGFLVAGGAMILEYQYKDTFFKRWLISYLGMAFVFAPMIIVGATEWDILKRLAVAGACVVGLLPFTLVFQLMQRASQRYAQKRLEELQREVDERNKRP